MPSSPPNSALVSEMAEAAPAFSGGAVESTREVVSVAVMPTPTVSRAYPAMSVPIRDSGPIPLTQKKPDADTASPTAMSQAGRTNRAPMDAAVTPATLPPTAGSIQRAASKGP